MTARPRSMRAALFGCAAANRASSTFLSSRTRPRSTPDWGLVMGRSLGLRRRAGFGPAIGYSARCGEGMRSGRLALLVAAGLSVGACGVTDAVAPPESGPCEITTLDPGAPDASFASGAACVIVAWDTTRFPSALTAD